MVGLAECLIGFDQQDMAILEVGIDSNEPRERPNDLAGARAASAARANAMVA